MLIFNLPLLLVFKYLFKFYNFYKILIIFLLLDIIICENTRAVRTNVFKELNSSFVRKANILPKQFITNFTSKNTEEEYTEGDEREIILTKTFTFNLTLLPHQIIIFPNQYFRNLRSELGDYKIFDTDELR